MQVLNHTDFQGLGQIREGPRGSVPASTRHPRFRRYTVKLRNGYSVTEPMGSKYWSRSVSICRYSGTKFGLMVSTKIVSMTAKLASLDSQ